MTTIVLLTPPGVLITPGGQWLLAVETRDADGYLSWAVTPTLLVTLPDGTTAGPVFTAGVLSGVWHASYMPISTGRYLAHAATPEDAVDAAAYVSGPVTQAGMPTVNDVARYLKGASASWTTDELQDVLDGETSAQQDRCGVRARYPYSLRMALLRRCQRALAMRALPLAVMQGDADGGSNILPGIDPEIRRLENPYRKLGTG